MMTDQQRQDRVKALLAERAGYVNRGLIERVEQVDAQLRALGADARPPVRRAERRRHK